ncbi:S-layer homology domain-containing protein [Chengkuizengella marina]|uniref:SLH domain-containing protein n=1 Tax=Chengkuizengella marina TaxID=2507566 RepID=A0A6N9Q8B4_9BACL|nr:S-layer homology domain-containing protein [Chengkuizengella marina]NBI31155.1 hypothetical protein [Chengkuizengella marina]
MKKVFIIILLLSLTFGNIMLSLAEDKTSVDKSVDEKQVEEGQSEIPSDEMEEASNNTDVNISTDQQSYIPEDTVVITGNILVNQQRMSEIDVLLTIKEGMNGIYTYQTKTDANGNYEFTYRIPEDANPGEYIVTVTSLQQSSELTFEVLQNNREEPEEPEPIQIELSVAADQHKYNQGDTVVILGNLKTINEEPVSDAEVSVRVETNDQHIFSDDIITNEEGFYAITFDLSEEAIEGEYEVLATYETQFVRSTFEVEELDEQPTPTEKELTVSTKKSKYNPGDEVSISGKVKKDGKSASSIDVLITVERNGQELFAGQETTNAQGKYSLNYRLGLDASIGEYDISATSVGITENTIFDVELKQSDNSSGGNDKPSNGGSGSTPPKDEVEDEILLVEEADIKDQLSSNLERNVEINLNDNTEDKVMVEMNKDILNKIHDANKTLVIEKENIKLNISPETLKGITGVSGNDITFSMDKVDPKKLTEANKDTDQTIVSDIVDLKITTKKNSNSIEISTFNEPIEIAININQILAKDTRKVAGYVLNEQENEWEYVGGKVKNGVLLIKTTHFSKYTAIANDKTFSDIQNINWAKDAIEVLASRSIIKGTSDDIFAPSDELTRAQFALLVVRALNIPLEEFKGSFIDVPESLTWSALEIEAAQRSGIVQGISEGVFEPNEKITREQMATMVVRAINYKNPALIDIKEELVFNDTSDIQAYALDAVSTAVSLGILKGKADNSFAPRDFATRAEAAVMLYNVLNILE